MRHLIGLDIPGWLDVFYDGRGGHDENLRGKSRQTIRKHTDRMSIFTWGCCLLILVTEMLFNEGNMTRLDCFIWPHKVRLVSQKKTLLPFFCWVLFTLPPSVIYSFTLYPLLILPFLSYLLTFSARNPVIKFIASQWERGGWKHRYSCHVESFQKRGSHPPSLQTHACSMRREAIRPAVVQNQTQTRSAESQQTDGEI